MSVNDWDAVVVDGARTPMARGGAGGALCNVPAEKFGAYLLSKLAARSGIDINQIDDVILGNVMGAYLCFARLCLLEAGFPVEIPGVTLDRNCASGLQAIIFASQAIRCGEADLIIAGGAESMTRQPWYFDKPATGYSRLPPAPRILSRMTAPPSFGEDNMGETAENLAQRYNISRQAQDELAVESHLRAQAAWEAGRFDNEVIPFPVPGRGGTEIMFERDETIRPPDPAKMAKLPTLFKKDGSVTAATSSPFTDGAAAVVIMSHAKAVSGGFKPLARVVSSASAGVDPAYMGLGPVPATRMALERAGLEMGDIGLVEMNEAFAAQALACYQELGLSRDMVNFNGGGMSLGHPIAATGARLSITLINEMIRQQVPYGLATMCVGGGQGAAVIYELL